MSKTVHEEARDIPVLDEVDVLVAGGGVAGCAAAVSAARAGARTVLLERNGCLGGVATATLMANIGNHYVNLTSEQVLRGFAAEVVERLVTVGGASPLWCHRDVPGVVIDSERFKVVLVELSEEAGVQVLTHALAARPIMEGGAVRGAFVESKSGRQAILAKATVDATGEADLAAQAGAQCKFSSASATVLFKLANVNLDAFVEFLKERPGDFPAPMDMVKNLETFDRNWRERGILFFPHGGGKAWPFLKEVVAKGEFESAVEPAFDLDAMGMYALRGNGWIVINSNFYRIADLDVRNLSRFELHAQKMCYHVAEFMVRRIPGFSRAYVAHVGVDLGIRASRFIRGRATLQSKVIHDAPGPVLFDDVVGVRPVRVTFRGEFFAPYTADIPFGITVPIGCDNLLVASGKSVSTEPAGLVRGMTGCMICGQAAGVASALAARAGVPSADVPVRQIQRELLAQGVHLGGPERLKQLALA